MIQVKSFVKKRDSTRV